MEKYQAWAGETLAKVRRKMAWVSEKNKDKIPYTTDETGSYDDRSDPTVSWNRDDGLNWWTNGFWGGLMWLLYRDTGEERYAEIARRTEKKLEQCFSDFCGLHHDVGFMYLFTSAANHRLTGSGDARRNALHAANLLAGRFNPAGRFIRAWNETEDKDVRGWAIIDCMMNISLLYWASQESGDPRFRQIAVMHADTTLKHFLRPDGSVRHIVEFDPETGACVIADGLLEVARFVPDCEKPLYTCAAVVQNCTAAYQDEKHHFPMVYADYFFIEALYKLAGGENLIW